MVSGGVVHTVPMDLRRVSISSPNVLAAWEDLTTLARNEWICWVLWPKKADTRSQHVQRVRSELLEGKRRPCCFDLSACTDPALSKNGTLRGAT